MDLIKKLPNDVKIHLSKFIFFKCYCCNQNFLKQELFVCHNCNKKVCKKNNVIVNTCNNCLEDEFINLIGNFSEYVSASCIIS